MRKTIAMLTIAAVMLTASVALAKTATTVEGTFKGALCAYLGKSHPAQLTKTQIALEPDFVLHDASGHDHPVKNLDRDVKVRYVNEKIRISGRMDDQGTLYAECLKVYQNDRFVTVWDLKRQRAEEARMNSGK